MAENLRPAGQRGAVEVEDTPVVGTPGVSQEQQFLLMNSGSVKTVEQYVGDTEIGTPTIQHTSPGRVLMWKPAARGYVPRYVSNTSIGPNLRNGWKTACPRSEERRVGKECRL